MALFLGSPLAACAWADSPTGTIPSIQATVSGLRFFEGDANLVPLKQRRYDDRFLYSAARFIHWELVLAHPAPARPTAFAVDEIWQGPRGMGYRRRRAFTLQPTWVTSYWSGSARLPVSRAVSVPSAGDWGVRCRGITGEWGPCEGGGQVEIAYWPRGSYRVDLFVDGRAVASGQFTMLGKDELEREIRSKLADRSRPTQEIPVLRGRVNALRFFEGGVPGPGAAARRYSSHFARGSARDITWDLDVKHAAPGRWVPLTFEALWYRAEPGGERLALRKVLQTAVSADWRDTHFYDDAESALPAGTYRVDVWVESRKIASESFEIR